MPLLTFSPTCEKFQAGISYHPPEWLHETSRPACRREVKVVGETGKARGKRKSVKFAPEITVYPVPSRTEMSEEEINRVWMDAHDIKNNRRDVVNTIYLMRSGLAPKLTEEDFFCPRGLEHLVNKQRQKAQVRRSILIALSMQTLLRKSGRASPQMIAKAYQKYTLKSQATAYKKALHDRAESTRKRRRDQISQQLRALFGKFPDLEHH